MKWNKNIIQLEKTVRLYYSKTGSYRTIILMEEPLYRVVTPVNYLVVQHWVEHYNKLVKAKPELKLEQIKKIDWLVMCKSYRRDLDELINKPIE